MDKSLLLQTAIAAAKAGEAIIQHYYRHNVGVTLKEDRTPVTVADVETERAIHAVLQGAYPDFGFYGEETARVNLDADYLWLVDPIDGTKSFIREYPFFSTQIALMHRGSLVLGVSNAPLFGEMAYAERGFGAFLNERPLGVSEVADLGQATLSLGNINTLARDPRRWGALGALIPRCNRVRGYGDFYHYHLLAAGKIDAVVESDVNILDIAALSVIVAESGGQMTALDGGAIGLETTGVLATNGPLHDPLRFGLA